MLNKGLFGLWLVLAQQASAEKAPWVELPQENNSNARAVLTLNSNEQSAVVCSNFIQQCTINIGSPTCINPPGFITVTNNSIISARNITASSTDTNFLNFVSQNNSCPPILRPRASCTISFISSASSPFLISNVMVKGTNTNTTFFNINALQCQPGETTLSVTPSTLVLSVNDTSLNPALTGNARQITIKNTGVTAATGLNIVYPTWPGGTPATTASSTCGSTLAAGATCTITVTPGVTPTSSCNTGIAPTPDTITVSAANVTTAITSDVVVLSYGCDYQGGFIYSIDDTTANTGSIGGKVASLIDQAAPYISSGPQATSIIWSSNGSGSASANGSNDIIPLISDSSTSNDSYANAQAAYNTTYANTATFPFPASTAFATCNGASEGQCNRGNILALYDAYKTGYGIGGSPYTLSAGPTNRTYYAAGLCTATINGYSDWYLPAICEMDAVNVFNTCLTGEQSMVASLAFLLGDPNAATPSTSCTPPAGADCLAGNYWSSTQYSGIPQSGAWYESFTTAGSHQFLTLVKSNQYGVRCSRALTF